MRRLAIVAVLAGCSQPASEICDAVSETAAVQAADRKIIGLGAAYDADGMLRGREQQLRSSQQARRVAAWKTIVKVLSPVAVNQQLPKQPGAALPAWQTWYGRDDLNRLFHRLYGGSGFGEAALDEALAWNVRAVDELPSWPEERWLEYLDSIDDAAKLAGTAGIAPVSYSPSAARHLLSSYEQIVACAESDRPASFVDGPDEGTRRLVRQPVSAGSCQILEYGPFFVSDNDSLTATVEGSASGATVVAIDQASKAVACRAEADEPCQLDGPGAYSISVTAGTGGLEGTLSVDYVEPNPDWSACLASAFPLDAVIVKASWHRAQFGAMLPAYDTSDDAVARVRGSEDAAWGDGDDVADPDPSDIHTVTLPNGNTYRLAALHIMTKELDHWQWITLWWSPDPAADFGADRPAEIAALGGPWRNYKMCTVTSFDGDDGEPTWCSNPYLERGAGNAGTNCIGCHQHAGTRLLSEDILADPDAFPEGGRTLLRNNFPTDYSFTVDTGDRLGRMFADIVEYYESAQ